MAFVTLRQPAAPILMFHGTSSVHLPAILERGLVPAPPAIASRVLDKGGAERLVAFEGTYLSYDPARALTHAESAVRAFGGEPLMVTARVMPGAGLPDEDEVLYVIDCQMDLACEERDWEQGFTGLFREDAYRRRFAADLAAAMEDGFEPDAFDREAAEGHLYALLEGVAMLPPHWTNATGNEGWLQQAWAMRMTRTPDGLERYRTALDGLCRTLPGARPNDATCMYDGYKQRHLAGVPLSGDTCIVAMGPTYEPMRDVDLLEELDIDLDEHLFAHDYFMRPCRRP